MSVESPVRTELAGCVIWNADGELLLLHRNNDGWRQWELPAGKIEEYDASPAAAGIREVEEELGVVVEQIGDEELGQAEFEQRGKQYLYHWIGARIIDGTVRIVEQENHDEYFFFAPCRLRSLRNAGLLSPNVDLLVPKIFEGEIQPPL